MDSTAVHPKHPFNAREKPIGYKFNTDFNNLYYSDYGNPIRFTKYTHIIKDKIVGKKEYGWIRSYSLVLKSYYRYIKERIIYDSLARRETSPYRDIPQMRDLYIISTTCNKTLTQPILKSCPDIAETDAFLLEKLNEVSVQHKQKIEERIASGKEPKIKVEEYRGFRAFSGRAEGGRRTRSKAKASGCRSRSRRRRRRSSK